MSSGLFKDVSMFILTHTKHSKMEAIPNGTLKLCRSSDTFLKAYVPNANNEMMK